MKYVSTRGGSPPTDLDDVILNGFAPDGGLYVPETIPRVDPARLASWRGLHFVDLACEIIQLFVPPEVVPAADLRRLLRESYARFEHPDVTPVMPLRREGQHPVYVLELFHGPTLSFKDVAMGFLCALTDYLLERRGQRKHLVVATTGDTGPAAAAASVGLKNVDTWVLYPKGGFVSDEQERQMTTLEAPNVHVVGVDGCKDGGDDLDEVVAKLFADARFRADVNLGSVNSINWGRVCVQTVHYFHAYLSIVDTVGEPVTFAVPTGAFGNLFAGYLAVAMGLPASTLVAATNENAAAHRALTTGVWARRPLVTTPSTAIDIAVPYNFWRTLYFATGGDAATIRAMQDEYAAGGEVKIPDAALATLRGVFLSAAVSSEQTIRTMNEEFLHDARKNGEARARGDGTNGGGGGGGGGDGIGGGLYGQTVRGGGGGGGGGYLMCPHTAVAMASVTSPGLLHRGAVPVALAASSPGSRVVVVATAHPCKFGDTVRRALGLSPSADVPAAAHHPSVEAARGLFHRRRECALENLEPSLRRSMAAVNRQRQGLAASSSAASPASSPAEGGDSRAAAATLRVVPLRALKASVTHKVARDAVAAAFVALARGDVVNPSPMSLTTTASSSDPTSAASEDTSQDGEVHVKAAWIKGSPTYAVKVAAGFYRNPAMYNLPSGSGAILVGGAASARAFIRSTV